jgi:hypothetical protein
MQMLGPIVPYAMVEIKDAIHDQSQGRISTIIEILQRWKSRDSTILLSTTIRQDFD